MASPRRQTTDDNRRPIIDSYIDGQSVSAIATILRMNQTTVHSVIKVYQNENRHTAKRRDGVPPTNLLMTIKYKLEVELTKIAL